jgi:RNA polymerase sigma factor (sigma-70 family)
MPRISQFNVQDTLIEDNRIVEPEDVSLKDNTSAVVSAFIECRQRLLKLAARILGCQYSAEDVVQDAYIKMLQASATFEIKYPISYLHQVVRNLAIDRFRRTALELRNFTNEDDGLQIAEPAQVPETIVIDRQHVRMVAHALSELPERTQTAFSLYSVDGYTQREIAKKLNVSPTLVNFMIRDAQSHCRNAMSDRY